MSASDAAVAQLPRERVLRVLGGKWLCAAVAAAAELGIPEALAERPRSVSDLGADLGCDSSALERLLSALRGAEFVDVDSEGNFRLTEAGACLREDDLGPLARLIGSDFNWAPWGAFAEGVKSGGASFEAYHGRGLFEHLDTDARAAAAYHDGIASFVRGEAQAIAESFDFSRAKRVVDLGGGQGDLLAEVLGRWPHLEGLLVERPFAAARAAERFARSGLGDRAEAREGDLLESIPEGFDVYVLKHVLHCLDDESARAVLAGCAARVPSDGAVLVIEGLRVPGGRLDQTGLLDLEMLMLFGRGRERSKPEMRRLFSAAGLRLVHAPVLPTGARLIVGERRSR